ncbi:MAG: hypothetical protein GX084_07680 [Acholeplasmataceae bacterium]|jgi:hypothetical protein|nr:hypothetical protein [Acidaminococcaceae bacterium]NLY84466.1 hypothetical protein [Acholeplasmataceae bacterium]
MVAGNLAVKTKSDLLTERYFSGHAAGKQVRDAVNGAAIAKGVGDVVHRRYLIRSQERKDGKRESTWTGPCH